MKTLKHIYTTVFCTILIFASCENLDDIEPLNGLDAENGITNENTANLALIGVYAAFTQASDSQGTPEIFILPSYLSNVGVVAPNSSTVESESYINNNPITNGDNNLGAYTRMYDLINRANWLIAGVNKLTDADFITTERRNEILGEAKALRALANFYLLRQWGEFYDSSSVYGITLRTEPATSTEVFPRNTVAESYAQIIQDLDDAIATAPISSVKNFVNQTFAKGLKAKVLLYQGNYLEAAALAKSVIDNPGGSFGLSSTYSEIFDGYSEVIYNTDELLFGTSGDNDKANLGMGNFWTSNIQASQNFIDLASTGVVTVGAQTINYDGGRVASSFFSFGGPFYNNEKYLNFFNGKSFEMIYHLRMAEINLIFAEADARVNNSVSTEALNALNAVRIRAGATTTGGNGFETYPASITLTQFLEAVRIEKSIELAGEIGEEWFDLVRYHFVDGFDVSTVKTSATNPEKYILPIPEQSVNATGGVVVQNPSY